MPKPRLPRMNFGGGNGRQSTAPNYSGAGGTFVPTMPAPTAPAASNPNPYQQTTWTPISLDPNGNAIWNPANWGAPMNFGPVNPTAGAPAPTPGRPASNTPTAAGSNIPWTPWQEGMGTNMNTHGYGGLNRQLTPWEQLTGQRRASGWRPGAMSPGGSGAGSYGGYRGTINDLPQRWGWNKPQQQSAPQGGGSAYNASQWSNGLVNWSI